MSSETQELLDICERLPQAQRAQVANYARFLLAAGDSARSRTTLSPLAALGALQASLGLTIEVSRKWIDDAASQRTAWGRAG